MVVLASSQKMLGLGFLLVILSLSFTRTKSFLPTFSSSVSVDYQQLNETSSSILMAESWLRTHVLAHYPSLQITTINVGEGVLCKHESEDKWDLVLPSMKNIHHSLVRWGLQKDIKVSTQISRECYKEDLIDRVIAPLFNFLQDIDSSFSTNPSFEPIKSRKLSFLSSNGENPFAPQSSTFPPLPQAQPPSMSFSFAPQSPSEVPYPPCYAPTPSAGEEVRGLWCVAKPSVPEEKLQEAMDYACGAGGADCEEIGVDGSCYYPDTLIAHASYAFNNYWQKNKKNGGTCSFGGTAMVINANPSFEHCRFLLS